MRWPILQIADSAFPTGGFAHSAGLEAAVHLGEATTPSALEGYVRAHVWNAGHAALPFVGATHDRPERVAELDALLDAILTSHVANRASRTQGRTFLATCERVFDDPRIAELSRRARDPDAPSHLAPVFGAVLHALGGERRETLGLYLYVSFRGVLSAAVRIGVAGPHEAQRLLRRHGALLDDVVRQCEGLAPDDAASVAPLADLMGATHDQLYSRLFQS
jgi:urease accessory protein